MEKIEVDPKLFVTCRLCLEDMGQYQIIPNIQHQIKYCYDIDVAPFDGLPQLICKKCETKLSEYFTTKTYYVGKQQFLINSVQNKKVVSQVQAENQTDVLQEALLGEAKVVTENTCEQDNNTVIAYQKPKNKKRRRIVSTSSSSSLESKDSIGSNVKPIKKRAKSIRGKWKNDYNKLYSCRICSKLYVKRNNLLIHYSNAHSMCLKKYKSILNSVCTVKIEKVDKKPNFTGINETVVLSKDKVTVNHGRSEFYILYSLNNDNNSKKELQPQKNTNEIFDSSDSEPSTTKNKRTRGRRLLSTDTVVIEEKYNNESMSSDDHFNGGQNEGKGNEIIINLDSDSEADTGPKTGKKNGDVVSFFFDTTLISNIMEVCHSKYIRNVAVEKSIRPNYANIESHLMHKVLNIGRKIINKQGFNCTGLLRFLEYRNLWVIWIEKPCTSGGPLIRISVTTMRKDEQKPEYSEMGWISLPIKSNIDINLNKKLDEINCSNKYDFKTGSRGNYSKDILNGTEVNTMTTFKIQNVSQEKNSSWDSIADQACLYKNDETSSSGKLLNKNPVANPKQLPKKIVHYEVQPNKNMLDKDLHSQNNMNDIDAAMFSETNDVSDNSLTGMPIITSTTSLASDYYQKNNESQENTHVSTPRIKVKPVSELMPENAPTPKNLLLPQNSFGQCNDGLPNVNVNMSNFIHKIQQLPLEVPIVQLVPAGQIPVNDTLPENPTNNFEYIVLHTVEMPNTKTTDPFKYVQNLLKIHNINLVEYNIDIDTRLYHCLIKFKVLFKQESVKSIVLCLSLHCNSNNIYIGIKDSTDVTIDLQKISANWQWEIIKIFRGDVSHKINQTAMKIGLEIYEHSNKFLCLVKSIQLK